MKIFEGKVKRLNRAQRANALAMIERLRPRDADGLHDFVNRVMGYDVPRQALMPGNDAPFDYLVHTYFEGEGGEASREGEEEETKAKKNPDVVVWAARGSGKTMLGAIATLLDMLFKPGIQVRILAGSLEQSLRMYEHLVKLLARPLIAPLLATEPTARHVRLINGSRCDVLVHSQASVRGVRVQKLRCDEVELVRSPIWDAAQLVTRSATCGERVVRGAVEAMSTMHLRFGPMSNLTRRKNLRVLRWNILDVAGPCPPELPCDRCAIRDDCRGMAKHGRGFMPIEDVLQQRQRVSNDTWAKEMMCRRPTQDSDAVFPNFDPTPGGRHVMPVSVGGGNSVLIAGVTPGLREPEDWCYNVSRPGILPGDIDDRVVHCAGIDFGVRNPFVMLWARFWPGRQGVDHVGAPLQDPRLGLVEIVDEHIEKGLLLDQNVREIERRGWPKPQWIGVDCSGGARNGQTGVSDIQFLRNRGYNVLARKEVVALGVDRIRRRLDHGTLRIAPRCVKLIRAMQDYHYNPRTQSETPVKDGPDHACDALRYLLMNLECRGEKVVIRDYW